VKISWLQWNGLAYKNVVYINVVTVYESDLHYQFCKIHFDVNLLTLLLIKIISSLAFQLSSLLKEWVNLLRKNIG
jgi:hypothetical protein